MDVYYSDYGFFPQMWFPVWSDENGQDDLIWYQAERFDGNTWHVRIDLSQHQSEGSYNMDAYGGTLEPQSYITSSTFMYPSELAVQ